MCKCVNYVAIVWNSLILKESFHEIKMIDTTCISGYIICNKLYLNYIFPENLRNN